MLPKERLAGYYDGGMGLFQKDEVKFNAIVKEEVSRRLPGFIYDKVSSDPLSGTVSFIRRAHDTGLLHYLTFGRDPSWRGKVFTIYFQVNKFPIMDCAHIWGAWWQFSGDSRSFTDDLWWRYDTVDNLRETLACAIDFIEDVGERFYREIGALMLQHYHGFTEDESKRN